MSKSGVVKNWNDDKGFGFIGLDSCFSLSLRVALRLVKSAVRAGRWQRGLVLPQLLPPGLQGAWKGRQGGLRL